MVNKKNNELSNNLTLKIHSWNVNGLDTLNNPNELKLKISQITGPFIIGGDFNCVLDPKLDLTNYNSKTHKYNQEHQLILQEILTEYNLIDIWRK